MRKGFAIACLSLFSCFLNPHAWAQNTTLGHFGVWVAYEARTAQGVRVCGIRTSGTSNHMHIKYFDGDDIFTIQIFNDNWNIPNRVDVSLAIELGPNYRTNNLRAFGFPRRDNVSAFVETGFNAEGSNAFWNAFRHAMSGRLIFLTGNEGAWSINLTGSNAATTAMQNCITRGDVTRRPFDAGTPRRPFDTSVGAPKSPF